ncbi:MAG TPA: tetratricopeptide repeat protein [Verrucomicrobiae bacterium]|jgi:tetratricopeptide (TPR) repeat protein
MKYWLSILIALLCAGEVLAADPVSDFSSANELYAKGKFADAASAYETILQSGQVSPNLLFNYGNAEFKTGNVGKAVAAFRQAELLSPRDPEIPANLDFVRGQVQGSSLHEGRLQGWLGQLTLNEWTLLAAVAFWLTFLLLAARQLRPALAPRLRWVTGWLIFLTVFFAAVAGAQAVEHFTQHSAVIVGDVVTRTGPFDDAQNAFAARDGTELSVLDQHGGWVQVTDGSGKIGWLSTKQVELIPGA